MRTTLAALSLAAGLGLMWCQSASAFPVDAVAIQQSARAASSIERTFYERHTRYGVEKCYREFVIGRYVCRHY